MENKKQSNRQDFLDTVVLVVSIFLALVIVWLFACFVEFSWINPFSEGYEFLESLNPESRMAMVIGVVLFWSYITFEMSKSRHKKKN